MYSSLLNLSLLSFAPTINLWSERIIQDLFLLFPGRLIVRFFESLNYASFAPIRNRYSFRVQGHRLISEAFLRLEVMERLFFFNATRFKLIYLIKNNLVLTKKLMKEILFKYSNIYLETWQLELVLFICLVRPNRLKGQRTKLLRMIYRRIAKSRSRSHLRILQQVYLELARMAEKNKLRNEYEWLMSCHDRAVKMEIRLLL